MIEPKRKSNITDKQSTEIDKKDNGRYAIGHKSDEEKEETRKMFRKYKEAYDER
ncbi:hypothetical protein LGQ02_19440 [Bacillus shivajii]|uniref:hypothetical protein n=1 Tax=Bacillus shivajii TaxID=1983719 RepID=UPI001CFA32C6|nr:hypothetical protein [Bacillus shivajii]UCZ52928.1 hypothetical protein LGQ02_19440 [Bacillus shivajii]